MGSIIIGFILCAGIFAAMRKILHDKKNGKSVQCGGDCRKCSGCCH